MRKTNKTRKSWKTGKEENEIVLQKKKSIVLLSPLYTVYFTISTSVDKNSQMGNFCKHASDTSEGIFFFQFWKKAAYNISLSFFKKRIIFQGNLPVGNQL